MYPAAHYGFGERFNTVNQRGKQLYCWTEDGGWGFGTELRLPKGPESTYVPMPWLLARRPGGYTYGLFVNSTYRTDWNLNAGSSTWTASETKREEESLTNKNFKGKDAITVAYALKDRTRFPLSDAGRKRNPPRTLLGKGYRITIENTSLPLVFIFGGDPSSTIASFTQQQFIVDPSNATVAQSGLDTVPGKGRSLIPPPFMFGPWNQFAHELPNVTDQIKAATIFRQRDIPSSVAIDPVHFFPAGSQRGHEKEIKSRNQLFAKMGYKTVSYYNSMIDTSYDAFNYTLQQGYLVKWRTPGNSSVSGTGGEVGPNSTYLFVYKGAGPDPFYCGLLDLTNSQAVLWFHQQFQQGIDLGYAGWMYDYGEYVDPNTSFSNGLTGQEMHNAYPLVYQKAAWEFFETLAPKAERIMGGYSYAPNYFFYVRSGFTGMQSTQYSQWTGDPSSDWTRHSGLPAQVSAMLNLGLSGVAYTGSDIGGFLWFDPPSPELWIRWAQVGAFSGTMHVQGGGTSVFGKPKSTIHDTELGSYVWRKLAKLRTALFPYIYSAAHENQRSGVPLMRHPLYDFPLDDTACGLEYQWKFGSAFLVAPVLSPNISTLDVYLPTSDIKGGTTFWLDFNDMALFDNSSGRFRFTSASLHKGGQWKTVQAPIEEIPTFVAAGSVIFTCDPSVDTLVTSSSPPLPPAANVLNTQLDDNVVGYDQLSNISHVWVFPRGTNGVGSVLAQGSSWDEIKVNVTSGTQTSLDSLSLFLELADMYSSARTVIFQLVLPISGIDTHWNATQVLLSGGPLEKVSYTDLLWAFESEQSSPETCWATSSEQLGMVWIRSGPHSEASRHFQIDFIA